MGTPRSATDFIVVHCSATLPQYDITEHDIRKWHREQGWSDVGYNVVIRRSGLIEIGRPLDFVGAHVAGFNHNSIGVCVIGGLSPIDGKPSEGISHYTAAQQDALLITLRFLRAYAPRARIQGHRDFPDVKKACPGFDVREWLHEVAPELLVDESTEAK